MKKVTGRVDDMLIIRGVNVFPSQVEAVLLTIPGIGSQYQLHVYRRNYLDELEVHVELSDSSLLDRYSELEDLARLIENKLYTVLSVHCKIRLVEPLSIERTPGKAKRVVDHRKEK